MMKYKFSFFVVFLGLFFITTGSASAHQPLLELKNASVGIINGELDLRGATMVADPTVASEAVYGYLSTPSEIDLYSFIASKDEIVPVEALVPVRPSNTNFRPSVVIIYPEERKDGIELDLPFHVPAGFGAVLVSPPSERNIFYEPFSSENLFHGNEQKMIVKSGKTYYVAVYEAGHYTGDYALGMGTAENFYNADYVKLIGTVLQMKFGLIGGKAIPWFDIIGLSVMIAGLVIGLGAVTVIDWIGILGTKSSYWAEAATRAHKVTKPLVWVGIILVIAGGLLYYRAFGFSSFAIFHSILAAVLILKSCIMTFMISPYLLKREKEGKSSELLPAKMKWTMGLNFVLSLIGWWTSLFLLVWQVLMLR
jgi:hypothetical protein